MKYFSCALLALLVMLSPFTLADKKLSEDSIQDVLESMRQAMSDKNSDVLLSYFLPDALVEFDLGQERGGSLEYSLSEYKRMLDENWNLIADFAYEVSQVRVQLAADGKTAIVTQRVHEAVRINGRSVTDTLSDETLTFKLADDEPKVSHYSSEMLQ